MTLFEQRRVGKLLQRADVLSRELSVFRQCQPRLAAGQELGAQLLTEGEEGVSSPAGGSSSFLSVLKSRLQQPRFKCESTHFTLRWLTQNLEISVTEVKVIFFHWRWLFQPS